jgi:hypothetical protein
MGEHLLRIALAELNIVRVICVQCGTAIETQLSALHCLDDAACSVCDTSFRLAALGSQSSKQFTSLQNALEAALALKGRCRIEFPISLDSREEPAK